MELDHDFTVAADADAAWPVLLDVERMHPLVPGAVYESGADGEYHGRLRIKFGPTTVTYRGTVRIAVVDDLTRTAILEITAREARGQGTVSGSLQATVLPSASSARVVLHTKLTFTGGRAASLSEHLVHDTGAKLLTRFSTNLNALLTSPAKPEPPAAEPVTIDAEELVPLEAPTLALLETEPATVETTLAELVTIDAEELAPLEAPTLALLETEPATVETTLAEPITIDAEELAPLEAPTLALLETEPATVETALAEPITIDAEELAPLEAPAPSPAETAPAERSAVVETAPLTVEAAPAETVTVGAEELVSAEAPAPAPVETAPVEAVSVEQGAAGAESPKAGGVGRVESGEGHRSELELYELSERAGWLRRVLPVFGVLVVVLVVRRFLRRR